CDTMAKVVVGFDGSANAATAVRFAADEARRRGVELELVHAWQDPYVVMPFDVVSVDFALIESAGQELLDGVVEELKLSHPDLVVRPVLVRGPARQAVMDAAEGAELLVVGARGAGGVVGVLLGSVSDHAARHARVPVAV